MRRRIEPVWSLDVGGCEMRLHDDYYLVPGAVGCPATADINALPPRAAMGLADHYTRQGWHSVESAAAKLGGLGPGGLAAVAETASQPFEARYAAGLLLAILGDPRIEPEAPAMCDVPSGQYRIGLEREGVEAVVAEFAAYGVLPEWIEKEVPAHEVELPAFRIAKYPVTQQEYALFLEDSGYYPFPHSWPFGVMDIRHRNHPVHGVGPEDADAYAEWLSARTGRKYRLPSEAEWEAAAGGGERTYPWGDRFERDRANTVEAGLLTTTPVGIFPSGASPFGCLDMAGNVEEYVADEYRPYPGGRAAADDLLEKNPKYRIARGGSFTRYRDLARCKRRHGNFESPLYILGFRLAETPEAE